MDLDKAFECLIEFLDTHTSIDYDDYTYNPNFSKIQIKRDQGIEGIHDFASFVKEMSLLADRMSVPPEDEEEQLWVSWGIVLIEKYLGVKDIFKALLGVPLLDDNIPDINENDYEDSTAAIKLVNQEYGVLSAFCNYKQAIEIDEYESPDVSGYQEIIQHHLNERDPERLLISTLKLNRITTCLHGKNIELFLQEDYLDDEYKLDITWDLDELFYWTFKKHIYVFSNPEFWVRCVLSTLLYGSLIDIFGDLYGKILFGMIFVIFIVGSTDALLIYVALWYRQISANRKKNSLYIAMNLENQYGGFVYLSDVNGHLHAEHTMTKRANRLQINLGAADTSCSSFGYELWGNIFSRHYAVDEKCITDANGDQIYENELHFFTLPIGTDPI